jgi:hypothetical protein
MSARGDVVSCGFEPEELLPPGAGRADGPSEALARHLGECPNCARTFASRLAIADRLRELPRLAAPRGPRSALDFAAIMERVDSSRLDQRLGAEEGWIRRLLACLPRLRAPATLATALQLPTTVRRRRVVFTHPAFVSLAAAAALVAAVTLALFDRSGGRSGGANPRRGLAAETAALSDREAIPVRVVYVDSRSQDAELLRPLRSTIPPISKPRRGGP